MIYEILEFETVDGAFESPGEIVQIFENRPQTKSHFTALVRLDSESYEDDGGKEEEMVPLETIDGVGQTVAERMRAARYSTVSQIRQADSDEMVRDVKGLGMGNVENIKNFVENNY